MCTNGWPPGTARQSSGWASTRATRLGLCYTSGSTGKPKGVVLTHRNLAANAFNMCIAVGYTRSDTFLHAAPMFHLADSSSIYSLTWLGARHVFLSRFGPAAVFDALARGRVTFTLLGPR